MLTRKQIDDALDVPMPSGVEATWEPTSNGFVIRFHRTIYYAFAVFPYMTEGDLAEKMKEAILSMTTYSPHEAP